MESLQIILDDLNRIDREVTAGFVPPKAQRPDLVGRVLRYAGLGSQGVHPLIDVLVAIADYYKHKLH